MSIEAMKQTFDFLYDLWEMKQTARSDRHKKVMWELDRAIGKAEKQKPSYWLGYGLQQIYYDKPFEGATPLYTAPPQREWVGLTYDDYENKQHWGKEFVIGAEWAEAKLKEKNAYGWQSVKHPTEYLDELRGGADE